MRKRSPEETIKEIVDHWYSKTDADFFPFDIEGVDGIKPNNPIMHNDTILIPNKELDRYGVANVRNNSMNLIFGRYEDVLTEVGEKQAEILKERHRDIEPELEIPEIRIKGDATFSPLRDPMDYHPSNKIHVSSQIVRFIDLDGNLKEVEGDRAFNNIPIDDAIRHELTHSLHYNFVEGEEIQNPIAREALATYETLKGGEQSCPPIIDDPWVAPDYLINNGIEFDKEKGYKVAEKYSHFYALYKALLTEEYYKGFEEPELQTRKEIRALKTDEDVEELNNKIYPALGIPNYLNCLNSAYSELNRKDKNEAREFLEDYESNIEYLGDNINGLTNYYCAFALSHTYDNLFGKSQISTDLRGKARVKKDEFISG